MSYIVNEKVVSKSIDGEAFLLNLKSGEYFGLNSTGALIWQAIESGQAEEEIVNSLVEKYQANKDEIIEDLQALVRELKSEQILLDE